MVTASKILLNSHKMALLLNQIMRLAPPLQYHHIPCCPSVSNPCHGTFE